MFKKIVNNIIIEKYKILIIGIVLLVILCIIMLLVISQKENINEKDY